MGRTPAQQLVDVRIGQARERLCDPAASVREVAEQVGFRSASHFSAVFRRETGLSPQEFRNRQSSGGITMNSAEKGSWTATEVLQVCAPLPGKRWGAI